MDLFGKNLRRRVEELELSNAAAARRIGLGERRFAHYIEGSREPDLKTLIMICEALDVDPNTLLGYRKSTGKKSEKERLIERLNVAARSIASTRDLKVSVAQVEAFLSS